MFTDGGSSASLIYEQKVIVSPTRFDMKNRLIATGIGIQPKQDFSFLISMASYLSNGGDKNSLTTYINSSLLTSAEKEQFLLELQTRSSCPFIDHPEFSQYFTSPFGNRLIEGEWKFHEGVDIRAQSPLDIKINLPGKVFRVNSGSGFGNYIIINHGRDSYGNYYFTLYAHLSLQSVTENTIVTSGQVIGKTGTSGPAGTQPHLHFELIMVNKPFPSINYQDLLSRDVHLDPQTFILPSSLTFE